MIRSRYGSRKDTFRGADESIGELFSHVDPEASVRKYHPLRSIRLLVNEALTTLDDDIGPTPPNRRRYTEVNFRGEMRSNETHVSTTDSDARLSRKGPGRKAQLERRIVTLNRLTVPKVDLA